MAKIDRKHLEKKYGTDSVKAGRLTELLDTMLTNNSKKITKETARLEKDHWESTIKKYLKPNERHVTFPIIQDIEKREAQLKEETRSRARGLVKALQSKIKGEVLVTLGSMPKSSVYRPLIRGGKKKRALSYETIKELRGNVSRLFTEYKEGKKGKYGKQISSYIDNVADSQTRGVINRTKAMYLNEFSRLNPDFQMFKKWKHHPELSEVPRKGHAIAGRKKAIPIEDMFEVPLWVQLKGEWQFVRNDFMRIPHDENAPLEQIMNCHCDCIYFAKRVKKV